jgi:putative tricarboxylic transport membrane protein
MGKNDYIGGGIFTALGVFIWAMTFQFPVLDDGHPGPSLFPRVLGTLFILFGIMVILSGRRAAGKAEAESPAEDEAQLNYFNPLLVIILIGAFIAIAPKLGFILTGAALLFILMMRLRVSPLKSSIISVVLICFIFFVFSKILRVPLPLGLLGW